MANKYPIPSSKIKSISIWSHIYNFFARRAFSVIIFGALFCTITVKLFHSHQMGLLNEYPHWIFTDILVLLAIEFTLALLCFRWSRKWVIRTAMILAALICTWSVINASWIIRTGTQILPMTLLPLIRDPVNSLQIVGVNLAKMPIAGTVLLAPSALALTFFFFALAKPQKANHENKFFIYRVIVSLIVIIFAGLAHNTTTKKKSAQIVSEGLRYNCHCRAITSLFNRSHAGARTNLTNATRKIPTFDQLAVPLLSSPQQSEYNVVIIVLEGVQYRYTSLKDKINNLTPHLAAIAEKGVEFTNTRSTLTHTTKALFSLLTGRFPSVSQDLAEAVPVGKPYAGITTVLKQSMNYRTAFFQSAKGNFECRPGLVHNLGFDTFWARDNLNDPNAFIGYLACDEFSMLKPITDWIESAPLPFFITILCSVSHDPYEIPEWYAEPAKQPIERYKQTIRYTDKFLEALDTEFANLNLTSKTILCVIGDHGEAFGEHGINGHERIAFEEALRIPWVIRAPFLVEQNIRISEPVSSVDLTPTLLTLLNLDITLADFDGVDALGNIPETRPVYFSGWITQGPAGFVNGNKKFVFEPLTKTVSLYSLDSDPFESNRTDLNPQDAQPIADKTLKWQKNCIFGLNQQQTGKIMLFNSWLCRWNNRVASAKYKPQNQK